MLELLVQKDPGAMARLLQLANSAYYRGSSASEVVSVPAALPRLGADAVIATLMTLWSIEDLQVPTALVPARRWMARHIFSLCATSRKVLQAANLLDSVPFLPVQTAALVDKMALATFLSVKEEASAGRSALLEDITANNHAFRTSPVMTLSLGRCERLAAHWGLNQEARELLDELRTWTDDWANASLAVQALVLSELLLVQAYEHAKGLSVGLAYQFALPTFAALGTEVFSGTGLDAVAAGSTAGAPLPLASFSSRARCSSMAFCSTAGSGAWCGSILKGVAPGIGGGRSFADAEGLAPFCGPGAGSCVLEQPAARAMLSSAPSQRRLFSWG